MATVDQISKLREQISDTKRNVSTVSDDLKLANLRKSLSVAEGTRATERWYGNEGETDTVTPEKPAKGVMSRLLDATMTPSYLATGAVKKMVGQAGDKSLGEAMINNVTDDKETFGTVLQNMGAPRLVSVPLGIAMDFAVAGALDPVVGFGAGGARYSSLIGRGMAGAKEAGVTGLKSGIKSSLLEKGAGALSTVSKVPGLGGLKTFAKKVGTKAIEATEGFEKLVGKDVLDLAEENVTRTMGSTTMLRLRNKLLEKAKGKTFNILGMKSTGEDVVDFFLGTKWNADWMHDSIIKDKFYKMGLVRNGKVIEKAEVDTLLRRSMKDRFDMAVQNQNIPKGQGIDVMQSIDIPGEKLNNVSDAVEGLKAPDYASKVSFDSMVDSMDEIAPELREFTAKLRQSMQDGLDVASASQDVVQAKNSAQIFERMVQEADLNKVTEAYYRAAGDLVAREKKWDVMAQLRNSVNKWEIKDEEGLKTVILEGTKALAKMGIKTEEIGRGLFSTSVVGALSPATLVGSVLSNPTMAMMMGMKSWGSGSYWKRIFEASSLVRGKSSAQVIEEMLNHPEVGGFLKEHPHIVEKLFGFDPANLNVTKMADDAIDTLRVSDPDTYKKIIQTTDETKIKEQLKIMLEQAKGVKDKTKNPLGSFADLLKRNQKKFSEDFKLKNGRLPKLEEYPNYEDLMRNNVSMMSQIDMGEFGKLRASISEKAGSEGGLWKVADWYLNKPMEIYGNSDSAFRFGTWRHLIEDGVTSEELEKMSRFVLMTRDDFTGFVANGGQKYYKMNAEKAAEVVSEMYMNYAALPGYIKMLRSLPIIGSPFLSFSGLMTAKTMQTLLYNPTAIMKLQMVLNDFEKANTPAEKAALETKYYSYLANDPLYINLGRNPFFKNNPVFLNTRQVNPMVSSLFSPSERTFSDSLKGNIGQAIDSSPFAQNPIGELLMTYLILPHFMDDGQPVQGQFGQPAYPKDATGWEKLGTALRDLPGAYVPSSVQAVTGLATGALNEEDAQGVIQNLPYTARRWGEAIRGKGTLGTGSASTIDNSRGEKTARAAASTGLGISLQSVDLNSVKNLKDKLK